jgi:hypothetical protein
MDREPRSGVREKKGDRDRLIRLAEIHPVHSKRKVVEPERLLGAYELAERVCGVFGCPHYEHLSIPQEVA